MKNTLFDNLKSTVKDLPFASPALEANLRIWNYRIKSRGIVAHTARKPLRKTSIVSELYK